MNGRIAKKLRKYAIKYTRQSFLDHVEAVRKWPFRARLKFCWYILTGKKIK